MPTGTVKSVHLDRGFGFIRPTGAMGRSQDVFFHANQLDDDLPFDATLIERRVDYAVISTEKGERAKCVRPAA